jgi:transposase
MDGFLFEAGFEEAAAAGEASSSSSGKPRLRTPVRDQVEFRSAALDELLDPNHPARTVWEAVRGLDLELWLKEIRAVEGHVGRAAVDPRLLLALWVYATLDGVASARELERLCEHHAAYRWLAGGVGVNHHLLSDFRGQNPAAWEELLTQLVAALLCEGLVTLNRVAQDGMRVRADAGKSSFRRRASLEKCLEEAREQVEALRRLAEDSPEELAPRRRAARERAAAERQARIEAAVRQCEELRKRREATAKKSGRKPAEGRASTTDPEARAMQFSDGGYRPGYNVQFTTDTASGIIVGADVTAEGTDGAQLSPMLAQLRRRYGRGPKEVLVDGGFATQESIRAAAEAECVAYAPLKDEARWNAAGKDPYLRRPGDDDAVAAWRARMGTAAAKTIYKLRTQTAEWVNAGCRNRGLWRMPVRGLAKVRIATLLQAITHNLRQSLRLRAAPAT